MNEARDPTFQTDGDSVLCRLLVQLADHQRLARRAIHLTPSENVLSPLARLPFVLDAYSRYFLDDLRLFGRWFFPGGKELGAIEQEVLIPLLRELARAAYVNVRPISGINCMTAGFAALGRQGETAYTVPLEVGGHASTPVVAERLGLCVRPIPFRNPFDIDLDRLTAELSQEKPALVYIDQSTQLFPIDPFPIREIIDAVSPGTLLHYDSSHVNGLILGGALFNPLERGAHSFGGSTHKTLPGPHKGFFATNDEGLARRFCSVTDHFVSHHHMADVVSLAVTLLELKTCGGGDYARRVITNAKAFAKALSDRGARVSSADRGFTGCHQVWVAAPPGPPIDHFTERLRQCGLVVNNFNRLPGLSDPAFRLSLAEGTRLGMLDEDAVTLADIFADALGEVPVLDDLQRRVEQLRSKFDGPRYCYTKDYLVHLGLPSEFRHIVSLVFGP